MTSAEKAVVGRMIKRLKARRDAFDTVSYYLNGAEILALSTKNLCLDEYDELLRLAEIGLGVEP